MPVTVVAALVDGKVNFVNIAHVGILNASAPHLISIGMNKSHYTNRGIKENRTFSVNLMPQEALMAVDFVGMASGHKTDKSGVFETFFGELGTAPLIASSAVSMECELYDTFDTPTHDLFIGKVIATYADEGVLTDEKVDLAKVRPLLFDMSSRKYWSLGAPIGDCWQAGRKYGV
ncbi:MAG TPA: flavin reductase family protein [Cyanobacteria bacterium UBA8530]|nr:flavin reductase family protein [Cyanobacteria bacterium UBA8530]